MESDVKNLLSEGKEVSVSIKLTYAGDSRRPDMITATVRTEDGKTLDKYKFDNNLDNSLIQELPSDRQLQAHKNIEEKGGAISSVKYSYDAAGNFATVAGKLLVPAAAYTQDAQTGAWIVTPSTSTLTVSGTIA